MGRMLSCRQPREVDPPKPGGIASGRRPIGVPCKSLGSTSTEVEVRQPSFGSHLSSPHTPSIVLPAGLLLRLSREADSGSAGAADGSTATALAVVAALAEHPHDHVEARPLNAPTAKPHATLQLSPATVTTDGLPRHSFADQQSTDAMACSCTGPSRSCRSRTVCLWS